MAKLIGSESAVTPTGRSVKAGKIYACKFTASAGTLEQLVIGVEQLQAIEAWVGIYQDSAGFPGTLLQQVKVALPQSLVLPELHLVTAAGFNIALNSGATYWLAAVSADLKEPLNPVTEVETGAENERLSIQNFAVPAKLKEVEAVGWTALLPNGPEIFYGNGTLAMVPHSLGIVEAGQKGGNA